FRKDPPDHPLPEFLVAFRDSWGFADRGKPVGFCIGFCSVFLGLLRFSNVLHQCLEGSGVGTLSG
ncbi:MAG TPA: hypothetical protein DHU56_08035, partial [Marinobacter sp.]|nr:hypothetical protein [Marinobacter sp.]